MSASKHFDRIACIVTALMLVITFWFMNGTVFGIETAERVMGYETRLFDNTRVHTIDIVMNDWDSFIDSATSEQYSPASIVIDGEAYKNVGIRGKGNTSLSSVSSMGSERYSFKIEFDQYDNSMSYHGLDKLSLNNLIQDSTMMKDYLTYTMMNEFGAAAPLCSFVYITVNGEDWGLYLAVEGVEDSFLTRNYGSDYGELYKPDSMSFGSGRGNGKDFNMDDFMTREESDTESAGRESSSRFDPSTMFGGMGEGFDFSQIPGMSGGNGGDTETDRGNMFSFGGFGMGSSDVKLQYIDDNLSSYSNIWNNAKTDITTNDQARLIESLKKLSNGQQIASVVDIEQVIRYFVVHNYVCNGDSYTGSMIHNYYLYEENGQLSMIPWDYNLAYGTFQGGNGASTVNTPIDAPVSGGEGSDRPMWYWILSDESYTDLYHKYFAEFLASVDIQAIIENAYSLIKPYVEKDPTAFYTAEQFEKGVETMRQFCALRSESISLQLQNGETTTNQNYVDASALTLSDMGSMGGGMGGGGMGGFGGRGDSSNDKAAGKDSPGRSESQTATDTEKAPANELKVPDSSTAGISVLSLSSTATVTPMANRPTAGGGGFGGGMGGGQMPEGFDPSQIPGGFGGQMPEGMDPSQIPGGFGGQMPEGMDPSQIPGGFGGSFFGQPDSSGSSSDTNKPSGSQISMPSSLRNSSVSAESWILVIISVLVLGAGLIVAKAYKY